MDRAGLQEIKKRFKFGECTFTKLAYATWSEDSAKVDFCDAKTFLNLKDSEQRKYLACLNKAYSLAGGMYAEDIEVSGDIRKVLDQINSSDANDPYFINMFAEKIMENYSAMGDYALIIFSDAYDIPTKDSAKMKTGESEEVYKYLAIVLCPFKVSKAGIIRENNGSLEEAGLIKVLDKPVASFLYPAFNERSEDRGKIFCNTKKNEERKLISALFQTEVPEYVKPERKSKKEEEKETLEKDVYERGNVSSELNESTNANMNANANTNVNLQTQGLGETGQEDDGLMNVQYGGNIPEDNGNKAIPSLDSGSTDYTGGYEMRDSDVFTKTTGEDAEPKEKTVVDGGMVQIPIPKPEKGKKKKIIEREVYGEKFYLIPASLVSLEQLKDLVDLEEEEN